MNSLNDTDEDIDFGKSIFKGRSGLPAQIIFFLCLPASIMFTFLLEKGSHHNSTFENLPPIALNDIGECHTQRTHSCTNIVYSPSTTKTDAIMEKVADANELKFGRDVLGFESTDSAKSFVASRLGRVQFTVFFRNDILWSTSALNASDLEQTSYTIFYNATTHRSKTSEKYNVDIPTLTLQRSLDQAIMIYLLGDDEIVYNADYGQLWALPSDVETMEANSTTKCDQKTRNLDAVSSLFPYLLAFCFMLMSTVAFQLIAEERSKQLFAYLRRLGLYDSAYWLSWAIVFQIILIAACALAMIAMAGVRSYSSTLADISFELMFLVFWVSGTGMIANGMFLASLNRSTSSSSSLVFGNLLLAVITIAACSTPLNSYSYQHIPVDVGEDGDGAAYEMKCVLVTSSYNYIYSDDMPGSELVQFIVFFMPWFHSVQAMTDILSIVQYKGNSVGAVLSDMQAPEHLYHGGTFFKSEWIGFSLGMITANFALYMTLAWLTGLLLSTDETEGRSLLSVFIPLRIRRLFQSDRGNDVLAHGDVRGSELHRSCEEGSVRAYKVSKTYNTVQALKEVSFSMQRGEVFVLLGHNGAGKSTLINIITGLASPSHGKVFISGLDVEVDAAAVQQITGVCPQHDLLWPDLTAKEHMYVVSAFKGIQWGEKMKEAVDKVLARVKLLERADSCCGEYSGGMKRRLSVAMSTVGEVEIVFLDEPTTGLDPLSRRQVWEMINWMKKTRVVVLTTHNMEEADFLGDNIMILHNGRVRAIGNSLFLKETYGSGYQINMISNAADVVEIQSLVAKVLPGATCSADPTTGSIAIGVSRQDTMHLPRLFAWLERSTKAAALIREWSISNTTLEQVFLLLCIQNTEVNYVDRRHEVGENMCPMCRLRPREATLLRTLLGQLIVVPASICRECSSGNAMYFVDEEDGEAAREDPMRINALLANAQSRTALASIQEALRDDDTCILDESDETEDSSCQDDAVNVCSPLLIAPAGEEHCVEHNEREPGSSQAAPAHASTLYEGTISGSPATQVKAILHKNLVLQSYQRCTNICSAVMFGIFFLLLYLFSFLFNSANFKQCNQGYISGGVCGEEDLITHVFSANNAASFDDDDELGPYGYTIETTIIPGGPGESVNVYGKYDTPYIYGMGVFPYYKQRNPVIWSDLHAAEDITSMRSRGLAFHIGSTPNMDNMSSYTTNTPNMLQYEAQERVYRGTILTNYPYCPLYSPFTTVGDEYSAPGDMSYTFGQNFSDACFACPRCTTSGPDDVLFDGTLWVSESEKSYDNSPSNNRFQYTYGYLNFVSANVEENVNYLSKFCPDGVAAAMKNIEAKYWSQNTIAMGYLNTLSNAMLDPTLDAFPIQASYSPYGSLFFDAQLISLITSFLLTTMTVLCLNVLWPLSVWRLAYERGSDISLMMRTVGMRAATYVGGMFLFDMILSVFLGVAMMGIAKGIGMFQYKDAPIGYLVAIVILSAYALNAFALVMVRLSPKNVSIISLVASCLAMGSALTAGLLSRLLYEKDGDWPWQLSLIPFFAQYRSLYIILAYHRTSEEVDVALSLLFVFGSGCLLLAYILELNLPLPVLLKLIASRTQNMMNSATDETHGPIHHTEMEGERGIDSDIEVGTTQENPFQQDTDGHMFLLSLDESGHDADVITEAEIARNYNSQQENVREEIYAMVLVNTTYFYSLSSAHIGRSSSEGGMWALKGISLSLKLGECFGLLGPNGAGKSTLVGILSGILDATSGEQYIGGKSIKTERTGIHKLVGICPQFDVVWGELTVEQHLTFQAEQRGIPSRLVYAEVQRVAIAVGLDGDGFRTQAARLSGGMRRRLSIGMSIVGDPPILFLDEPTTGLDPDNRQAVWKIIQKLKQLPHRLILITTHSMQEAEALCTRIGIVSGGRLKCVGTSSHLKGKFGKGYTLTVNSIPSSSSTEDARMRETLFTFIRDEISQGQGELISSINRTSKFLIPKGSATISDVFHKMENNKNFLHVREWGLSMATLEEVFVTAVQQP